MGPSMNIVAEVVAKRATIGTISIACGPHEIADDHEKAEDQDSDSHKNHYSHLRTPPPDRLTSVLLLPGRAAQPRDPGS